MKTDYTKIICSVILILFFILFVIFHNQFCVIQDLKVTNVISPLDIELSNGKTFRLNNYQTFDSSYTENNKILSKKLNITEDEAFILGNLGKYWTLDTLGFRRIILTDKDLIHSYKYGYRLNFENSPFALKDNKIMNQSAFKRQLNTIRKGKYVILNLDDDTFCPVSKENAEEISHFVVVRRSHIKNSSVFRKKLNRDEISETDLNILGNRKFKPILDLGDIKLIVSDMTSKLKPDRNCSSEICKEILTNINNTHTSLDIAIYGYSSTPAIEKALMNAQRRGVRIRIVYDLDSKGENIYPDTKSLINLFSANQSDINSSEVQKIMHNKFYIFDENIVITGSANLSHTDMSGFNSNSIIVLKSPNVAKIYKQEFDQMYFGKFHNDKLSFRKEEPANMKIYFSPQDKGTTNGILPIIRKAKDYIYVPSFIITHKEFVNELIKAKNRGVDVRVIVDSLNASGNYSKHILLREAGIPVKAENYAGKMHSKSLIIDDKYLVIGSMNFSSGGENKNDENFIILENPQAAMFYREFFLYQWSRIPDKWLKKVPRAEGKDSIGSCSDGIDNNYDGKVDLEDEACKN